MTPAARIILDEVDSTMAEAARRAPALAGPTWIVARHQSAAKGRRGRPWQQSTGNFAATLVMPVAPRHAALRSFTASLALAEACAAFGVADIRLKWPNDVLVGGGKVAGILLEMLPNDRLAIGIGVNLRHVPDPADLEPGAAPPATLDLDIGPESFLNALAPRVAEWEERFATYGFPPVRDAWLARAAKLGEPIRARTVTEEHHGVFETIDNEGRLVLSTANGRVTIPAADVYF